MWETATNILATFTSLKRQPFRADLAWRLKHMPSRNSPPPSKTAIVPIFFNPQPSVLSPVVNLNEVLTYGVLISSGTTKGENLFYERQIL